MVILGIEVKELANKVRQNIVLSTIVVIIGLLSSIFGIWQYAETKYYSRDEVIKRLNAFDAEKDFSKEYDELRKIQFKDNLKDVYAAYAAVLSVKNGTISTGSPDAYVREIPPTSDLYLKGQSALVMYYLALYNADNAKQAKKLSEIADGIKRDRGEIAQYYYLKLLAIYIGGAFSPTNYNYQSIEQLYIQFVNKYKDVIDFSTYDLHFRHPDKGFVIIDDGIHAPTLALFFHIMLAYSAHLHEKFDARDRSVSEIQRILQNRNDKNLVLALDSVFDGVTMGGLGSDLMSRVNFNALRPN